MRENNRFLGTAREGYFIQHLFRQRDYPSNGLIRKNLPMDKYALPLVCLCFTFLPKTSAQIAAGVTDHLVVGGKNVQLAVFAPNAGSYDLKRDSIDFDGDGKHDALLIAEAAWVPDYVGGSASIEALHPGFEVMMDSSDFVRPLMAGDSIKATQNWSVSSHPGNLYASTFIARFWGFSGQLQQYGNWMPPASTAFVGFRIVTAQQDTLYGWFHVTASANANFPSASLSVNGLWAIEHDPSKKPWVKTFKTPQKDVYCPGDYVIFEANTAGAEQIAWHFWDGTSDTAATVIKVLPDSTVTAIFEATNQNGTTTVTQNLEVSPLKLTAPDIVLDCAHPTGTLTAETSIPAEICWVVASDTSCNPIPPTINFPGPITVFAEDNYGCIVTEQVEVLLDANTPIVFIEYDEPNHLLIAYSNTPNVTFSWVSLHWPILNDSVFISQSGTYTVVVTAPNGCTSSASITVVITSTDEPPLERVRVQPNPASDFLQIENRLFSDLSLKIFDAAGSLKMANGTVLGNSVARLDIEFLPAGLYLLIGCDVGGKPLFFKKFLKQ